MSLRDRLLGLIPLIFFTVNLIHHAENGDPQQILWLCNLDNFLLALGFLLNAPVLFRIGILWLIPGFPLWLIDAYRNNNLPVSSVLAHFGALVFGSIFLRKIGMTKSAWMPAILYAVFIQQLCRFLTPAALNINVAHTMYPGWENIFNEYWKFWIFILLEAIAAMFLLSLLLSRYFPPRVPSTK